MDLLVLDTRTGIEERYEISQGGAFFDFDSTGMLRRTTTDGLRIELTRRNVFITDQGAKERSRLGDRELPSQTRWIWQANQELRIGPYILLWRPSQSWLQRRMRALIPDRLSPIVTALFILLLVVGLVLIGIYLLDRQSKTLESATTPLVWPRLFANLPALPTTTPTTTPTAPTATPTLTPTGIMTVTAEDKAPTATPTPTATESITQAMKRLGAGAVISGTPVIDAHKLTPEPGHWDTRLERLGVAYQPALVPIGGQFWRLIDAQWLDETASNGMHHVFVEVVDEQNNRILEPVTMTMAWTTGTCLVYMQNTPPLQIGTQQFRPYGMNCPMYSAGPVYSVKINGFGLPSDLLLNLGLGSLDRPDWDIRTSFLLIFQRATRTE